ncbi:MAG: flagellar biosynthesis protein FliQ [Nitrospirales bacterium]
MTPETVMDVARLAIETTMLVAGPMLLLSLVVGLFVGAFQAMTQINEMTLTFVPKIIGIFLVLLIGFPWLLQVYLGFMTTLLVNIPNYIR